MANEWLDNIPCHVVEVDPVGVLRVVHVDPVTGEETLGQPLTHSTVAASLPAWVERWWPLDAREPGTRAEVGSTRDAAWSDAVSRLTRGIAVAVDYGHTRDDRPAFGSLRSYRDGQEVDVLPDGSRDVTAHVAVDAVADRSAPTYDGSGTCCASSASPASGPTSTWPRATRRRTSGRSAPPRRRPSSPRPAGSGTSGGS